MHSSTMLMSCRDALGVDDRWGAWAVLTRVLLKTTHAKPLCLASLQEEKDALIYTSRESCL
jgi:hypothetical protein